MYGCDRERVRVFTVLQYAVGLSCLQCNLLLHSLANNAVTWMPMLHS